MSPMAILFILGLSFSVDAFSSSLSLPRRQQSVSNRLKKSRLFYVPEEEEEESSPISSFTSSWSLEQDWALIDQLPKFTVGEGSHIRTFWTQLLACTPILSEKSPDSLFRRCQELKSIQEKYNNTTTAKASGRPIIFGPAPILLTNWQIDFDHLDGKAVGQTKDGRSIWLRYISLGRLEGDPFSDSSSSSIFSLIPGGYLEAVGGRIYELGEPRSVQQTPESSIAVATASIENDKEHKTTKLFDWWVPATTATVSALLASTILSACIGYGAGLSIISDGSHSTAQHSSTVVPPITSATNTKTQPIVNLGETASSPTISEQRARVEYRIIREQRLLKSVSDKIERDQNELLKLRRIENSQ